MLITLDSDRSPSHTLSSKASISSLPELAGLKKNFNERCKSEKLDFYYYKGKKRIYQFNNANLERFMRRKLQIVLIVQNFVSVTLIFNGYFAQLYEADQLLSDRTCRFMLIMQSILTLLFLVLLVIGENTRMKLKKVRYNIVNSVKYPWTQIMLLVISFWSLVVHPSAWLMYVKAAREQYLYDHRTTLYLSRNVNEYLYIIQFTCLYIHMIRNFFTVSRFTRNSVYRICRMFNMEMRFKFIFQCYMRTNQFRFFCQLFFYTIFYYSMAIQIAELPVAILQPQFQDFLSSIWFTWITIFTIGFGDMVPITLLGRILVMMLLLQGLIIIPMITTSFTNKSKFDSLQQTTNLLHERIKARERLQQCVKKITKFLETESHMLEAEQGFLNANKMGMRVYLLHSEIREDIFKYRELYQMSEFDRMSFHIARVGYAVEILEQVINLEALEESEVSSENDSDDDSEDFSFSHFHHFR